MYPWSGSIAVKEDFARLTAKCLVVESRTCLQEKSVVIFEKTLNHF